MVAEEELKGIEGSRRTRGRRLKLGGKRESKKEELEQWGGGN